MVDSLPDFFQQNEEFVDNTYFEGEDFFSIFESLENVADFTIVDCEETSSFVLSETEFEAASPKNKRLKTTQTTSRAAPAAVSCFSDEANPDGIQRISHITVERNRRKQMNEHLSVLRSLMPCFYVKKGDQASIIGGVVEYIKELEQVLKSLEAKKQRKVYSEVLSPRLVSSPRKPPLSPRVLNLPISPRTPQPTSPYNKPPRLQPSNVVTCNSLEPSPCNSSSTANSSIDSVNELVANSKTAMAEVEVKFTGPNVVLKTKSPRILGQTAKIISALELLSLEILHVNITSVDETMFNSFTIKIGIECQLSAEELAHQIQQTFC